MNPALYRKKPIVIKAVQITVSNIHAVSNWINANVNEPAPRSAVVFSHGDGDDLIIRTLEGWMKGNVGDWVIQGVKGEFYPCRDDIFKETYEGV